MFLTVTVNRDKLLNI